MQRLKEIRVDCGLQWWNGIEEHTITRRVPATPDFVEVLSSQRISLLIVSRRDSTVTVLSAVDGRCVATQARMPGPMGAATRGDAIAFGTAMGIRIYRNLTETDPDTAIYLPLTMHFTAAIGIHDVGWDSGDRLWFVNTVFSALCQIDAESHFRLVWRPHFLREGGPRDCCHLNGMALDDAGPRFVTALSSTGTRESWRATAPDSGILMDVNAGILRENLSLPHSPRIHDGSVWLLESGRGKLVTVATDNSRAETVWDANGILRGLDFAGGIAFIGQSKLRQSSGDVFAALSQRLQDPPCCRVHAVDVRRGEVVGHVELPEISEISSVSVVAKPRVFLLEPDQTQAAATFVYRDEAGAMGESPSNSPGERR